MDEVTTEQKYIYKLTGQWESNELAAEEAVGYGREYVRDKYPAREDWDTEDDCD